MGHQQLGVNRLQPKALRKFWTCFLLPPLLNNVSDGKSEAWFTRGNLVNSSSWESVSGGIKYSASYTIDPKTRPPERLQLDPGQSTKVRGTFKVPAGQFNLWLDMAVAFTKKNPWRT